MHKFKSLGFVCSPSFFSPNRVSFVLAWGDFHARSRFARSTIPEEKWGTTRSLEKTRKENENWQEKCSIQER